MDMPSTAQFHDKTDKKNVSLSTMMLAVFSSDGESENNLKSTTQKNQAFLHPDTNCSYSGKGFTAVNAHSQYSGKRISGKELYNQRKFTTVRRTSPMDATILTIIIAVIGWIASINATSALPPIRNSEIQPGALVFFLRDRVQKSDDLNQRATQMDMQLARIMDPPFDLERRRVNIEKLFDPVVKVGVKPKHLVLAKSLLPDELVLAPSPNQKLQVEIFKVPNGQPVGETIIREIILANRLENCDRVFLIHRTLTADPMRSLLKKTAKCPYYRSQDPDEVRVQDNHKSEYLVRFLDKITSLSHLDSNTFDDFRELVAQNVFSVYGGFGDYEHPVFEGMVNQIPCVQEQAPKSSKILRIFYRNLQRDKPTVCPKLEVMRDDFLDFQMVHDMLFFIWQRYMHLDYASNMEYLPTLYQLMDSDTETTGKMWEWGIKDHITGLFSIADFVCRKIGMSTEYEDRHTNEQVLRKVMEIRNAVERGCQIYMRAEVFGAYWQQLYELKRSGFSGRIAIVNRHYILEDSWIQSLFGIFGRDNTEIEHMAEL